MAQIFVHIADSNGPDDFEEGPALLNLLQRLHIPHRYHRINTQEDLQALVRNIIAEAERGPSSRDPDVPVPVLHLTSHGNRRSAVLNFGSIIWDELAKVAATLIDHTAELGIVMSLCHGAEGVQMLRHPDYPFDYLVGPTEPLSAGELVDAWARFYEAFREDGEPAAGLKAIGDPRFVSYELVSENERWHVEYLQLNGAGRVVCQQIPIRP